MMRARILSSGKLRLRNGVLALVAAAVISGGDATAITLVDYLDQSVIQRLNDQRVVPVAGNVTGPAGTPVEARVVTFSSGAAVTAWAAVGTSAADGSFSGSHTAPRGGWYKLQVRAAGSQTVVATGTSRWGVGAVIGWTGQSNAVQALNAYEKYITGAPRSVIYDSNIFKRLGAIVDTSPPNTQSSLPNVDFASNLSGDAIVYVANTIGIEFDMPVCIVHSAQNGMGIGYWTQGTKQGWTDLVAKLNQMGGDMEAMIFMQGESSAHAYSAFGSISAEWDALMVQALTQTGRTTDNFKIIMTSLGPGNYSGSTEGEFGRYRIFQITQATTKPGWIYGGGPHAIHISADEVHFGAPGKAYLGRVMPMNYLNRAFGRGISGEGPRITGATRSGLNVTFTVTHAGGSTLVDGVGGNGSALTGFRFFDAGASGAMIGYSSTLILNATQFRVTLNSLPAGVLTTDYAITDVPHGVYNPTAAGNLADPKVTYVPASTLRDNVALINNVSFGCILQPCAAITVTGG